MSLTKTSILDKIEMFDTGRGWHIVQCRRADIISENGEEISRSYHRYCINPDADWSSEPEQVQAICNVAHTTDEIAAFTAAMGNGEVV